LYGRKSPLKAKRGLAPSASLRISAAGSDARKATQLEWGTGDWVRRQICIAFTSDRAGRIIIARSAAVS
jgi:hypothetical protein